ncbi:hypothetical protein HUG17_4641 [Dermatophagoides farinae]|nr:hypothetical protein HUG17_4641 [Dermatophagoides farinae]
MSKGMNQEIEEFIECMEKMKNQMERHVPLTVSEKKYKESLKKIGKNFENKREQLLNSCPKLNEHLKPGEQKKEHIHLSEDLLNDLAQFYEFQKLIKKIY